MRIAITRQVSPGIARCVLTHLERQSIDPGVAGAQHRRYETCLTELGCTVHSLPAEPDLPDSVFVEDVAVVLDELAVLTRPGAASRRPETAGVAAALAPYRRLVRIEPPGTLDGGDVLVAGRGVHVGRTTRSDESGIEQLRRLLGPEGYTVIPVEVHGCLHLKSAVTLVAPDTLLVNRDWVDVEVFPGKRLLEVDPGEPFAANALRIGAQVVYPAAFPRTRARLAAAGIEAVTVDVSELAKAEGAVTCCSLVFEG